MKEITQWCEYRKQTSLAATERLSTRWLNTHFLLPPSIFLHLGIPLVKRRGRGENMTMCRLSGSPQVSHIWGRRRGFPFLGSTPKSLTRLKDLVEPGASSASLVSLYPITFHCSHIRRCVPWEGPINFILFSPKFWNNWKQHNRLEDRKIV